MKKKLFLLLTLTSFVVLSVYNCAEERDPINRVQPNYIKKSDLADKEWYFQQTVVDIPGSLSFTFVGETNWWGLERIRWDIQEDYLYARRSYELVEGAEGATVEDGTNPDNGGAIAGTQYVEDGNPYMGAIVAAFKIESHFDIRREYNPTTGEELNVVVENTTDKPWYEREYIRVDWSENLVTNFKFSVDDVQQDSVPYYVQDSDVNADDRPVFDYDDNENLAYFDITTQMAATPGETIIPGYGIIPTCYLFYHETDDCTTQFITIRNSFLNIDSGHQYEAMVHKGPITDMFGFFTTDRLVFEQHQGVTEPQRKRFINRHNIWEESFRDQTCSEDSDCEDVDDSRCDPIEHFCTIPYAQRTPRPIVYYLYDWPEELEEKAEVVEGQWNKVFTEVVSVLQDKPIEEVPQMFVMCHNPVESGDPEICGEEGYHPRIGDIRYSFMAWVKKWYDGFKLLGLGPSNSDPLTGEIISGMAYIYSHNDTAATQIEEMVRLLNGEISPDNYIDGVDLSRWVEQTNQNEAQSQRILNDDNVRSMYKNMDTDWMSQIPHNDIDIPEGRVIRRNEMGTLLGSLRRAGAYNSDTDLGDGFLYALNGTPIEQYLVNEEILMASGISPNTPVDNDVLNYASPSRGGFIELLKNIQDYRESLSSKNGCMYFADMADDAMMGLARQLKGMSSEEIWETAREIIINAVLAHELGHSLGLMHNFAGSEDVFNYDPEYWRLRTHDFTQQPSIRYEDPITEDEINGNIYNYAYSSIMDYAGRYTIDGRGVAKYDRAAMLYGYARMIEVFKDTVDADTDDLIDYYSSLGNPISFWSNGPTSIHYTEWYRLMGKKMFEDDNRMLVPVDNIESNMMTIEAPDRRVYTRVPYLFCAETKADISEGCLRRDFGADIYERMYYHIQDYNTWYIMRNFTRYHYGVSPEYFIERYYERLYERLKGFNDVYALYLGLLNTIYTQNQIEEFLSDPATGWGGYTVAIHDAFNQLIRIITSPNAGDYEGSTKPDGSYSYSEAVWSGQQYPSLDVTQGRYFTTTWWDSTGGDSCGLNWWECLHHIGFYLDKIMALMALSNSETYFVARDTAEDIRMWRISFFDNYATQINNIFANMLSENYEAYAPYLVPDGANSNLVLRDYADPTQDPAPPDTAAPVDPYTGFTVQLYSAVLGMSRFRNNFDNSFVHSSRMWLHGSGQDIETPFGTVSYTDPESGYVYEATDIANSDGIAETMIRHANKLKARSSYCNPDDEDAPDYCETGLMFDQISQATGALKLYKDQLDIMVELTGYYNSWTSGYGNPFDPGTIDN